MNQFRIQAFRLIIAATGIALASSCVVTKKKYDALEAKRVSQLDSVNGILAETFADYGRQRNLYAESDARKTTAIDSLDKERRRLASDTLSLNTRLRDAIVEYNTEKSKLVTMERNLNKKAMLADSLSQSLTEKEVRLEELNKMIDANKLQVDELRNTINAALGAFDKSELNVSIRDGKVYVAMEEKLLFKTGSADIDKKGIEAVKKVAEVLEKNPNIDVLIEGHTDNVGRADYNWKLSSDRALSIVQIIQTASKVDPTRITASGRGMYQPIADNATAEGKQKNRRIDIILVPKLDALYKVMGK
jgi:chemotaxis protein MotB